MGEVERDMSQELFTVVTRKGQITVPAAIRRALKINVGDKVALSIREGHDGEAILRPARSVAEATYGVANGRSGQAAGLDALRDQFEEGLTEDAAEGLAAPESSR